MRYSYLLKIWNIRLLSPLGSCGAAIVWRQVYFITCDEKINDLKIIGISSQSCSRENRSLGCTCPFKTCSSIKGKIIGTIAQSWRRFPNFHTWNRFLIPKNRKTLGQTTILPSEDSYTSLTYPRKNHWNQWNQLGDLLRFCFAPGQKSI